MHILHVLHLSLPFVCGYSIRSEQILTLQRKMGIQVSVLTSAQQPEALLDAVLDGIAYFRTPPRRLMRSPIREWQLMSALFRRIGAVLEKVRPDIVHAHSPILVGLPAYLAARRRGLPFVYEVRDLWENASVDRGKFAAWSLSYRAARALETWLLRRADAVVTIGETLRDELQGRTTRDVVITANGADPEVFRPIDPDPEWRRQWNSQGDQVVAYIGSFQPYEGLEILIHAMKPIVVQRNRVHLLIAGDGPERAGLQALVAKEGLANHVTFTGRLPHGRVKEIYAVADLLVYPRIATLTTQLTTPLKPLEAFAMQKAVLASNLPAMRELVSHEETGLLFEPGNAAELAKQALRLLGDPALRVKLGRAARQWVAQHRLWESSVARYEPVYAGLLSKGTRRG